MYKCELDSNMTRRLFLLSVVGYGGLVEGEHSVAAAGWMSCDSFLRPPLDESYSGGWIRFDISGRQQTCRIRFRWLCAILTSC